MANMARPRPKHIKHGSGPVFWLWLVLRVAKIRPGPLLEKKLGSCYIITTKKIENLIAK